jgi:hypothetical protein
VLVVHGTKKFLDRVGSASAPPDEMSTTRLGAWYATVLLWRPQVALFVNETTFLPVLMPLAPAATLLQRFPATLGRVLTAHGIAPSAIEAERAEMKHVALATTKNRSVVGVMNEFSYLAGAYREGIDGLDELSVRLARTPCGPLSATHVFPDRALTAAFEEPPPRGVTGV